MPVRLLRHIIGQSARNIRRTVMSAGLFLSAKMALLIALATYPFDLLDGQAQLAETAPLAAGWVAPDATSSAIVMRMDAANDALVLGLASVADSICAELLQGANLSERARFDLLVIRVRALLMQEGYAAAAAIAEQLGAERPEALLLRAITMGLNRDPAGAAGLLGQIEADSLPAEYASYFTFASALIAESQADSSRASRLYDRALAQATDTSARLALDIASRRWRLRSGTPVSDAEIASLRQSARDLQGQRAGFEAARLLALSLGQSGRSTEAIALVDEQLALLPIREGELAAEFNFIKALLLGESTERGRAALQEVLRLSQNRNLLQLALRLFASGLTSRADNDSAISFLGSLIERSGGHPLQDELLAVRARLNLSENRLNDAEADSNRLLSAFPASPLRTGTIQLLAYIAYSRQPPQYRSAADSLNRLRTEIADADKRWLYGLLVADCFFLNGDFENAADSYASIYPQALPQDRGGVLFQRTLSDIRAGRASDIPEYLDQAYTLPDFPLNDLWQAEWNYISSLKGANALADAFARVRLVAERADRFSDDPLLRLRFFWLEAQLSIDSRQPQGTPERVDRLLAIVESLPADSLETAFRSELVARLLLLKGQAFLQLERPADALAVFSQVRSLDPASEAAAMTYLSEARYYASQGGLIEAQQQFIALVDAIPQSPFAPLALWEAALQSEQRGLNSSYAEAIQILERIPREYPTSSMRFFARLKQGDLSRRLGDFAAALQVYERVLSEFATHPQRLRAELNRADCLLALGATNAVSLDEAAAQFGRIFDLPDSSPAVQAEAGYKWAYALSQQRNRDRAHTIWWLVVSRLLSISAPLGQPSQNTPIVPQLDANARYWVGRSLVDLASGLEADSRFQEARHAYDIIISYGLPGRALAEGKLLRLSTP